jgi:Protein of unknown function (DUF2934)
MAKQATPRSGGRRTVRSVKDGPTDAPENTTPTNGQPSEEDVRVRAYHKYLERGATDGHDLNDWVEAEQELRLSRQS